MSEKIQIRYAEDEVGSAEPLGERFARLDHESIVNDDISQDDIVRLTHMPGEAPGIPAILEVVHQRHSCRTFLHVEDEDEVFILSQHLRLARAELVFLLGPDDGKPGLIKVAHSEEVDPELLAKALGLEMKNPFADLIDPDDDEPTSEDGEVKDSSPA